MAEEFDFGAYTAALRNMNEAVKRVTGITYDMMAAGFDLASKSDYSAFARVQFVGGELRYEPITAEEFYAHASGGSED